MKHILIVDDEPAICWSLERLLRAEKYTVTTASSAETALESAIASRPNLIFLDVRLPGMSGLDAVARFREVAPTASIILMTAFSDLETTLRAFEKHVAEFLPKPFDLEIAIQLAQRLLDERIESSSASRDVVPASDDEKLIGQSSAMQDVFRRIAIASSSHVPVLISGESGTGKNLVANIIHSNSSRSAHRIQRLSLPVSQDALLDDLLFGVQAAGDKDADTPSEAGLWGRSTEGTLVFDDVAELPIAQQARLLRILESNESNRNAKEVPGRVPRIIAITNQDLAAMVAEKQFREDLYFRLAVMELKLPPLRERIDDIPLLCQHFLRRSGYQQLEDALNFELVQELKARTWFGNVRELKNLLEQASLLARRSRIERHYLFSPVAKSRRVDTDTSLVSSVADWAKQALENYEPTPIGLVESFQDIVEPLLFDEVLRYTQGNQAAAAQILGIHRSTLREKLRYHQTRRTT